MISWFKNFFGPKPLPVPPPEPAPRPPQFGGAGASGSWENSVAITKQTRGIRNKNPGNVRGAQIKWQGEIGRDYSNFVVFESAVMGMRALGKILVTYQDRYGLRTLAGIINRWAPPVENNTSAYVRAVAREVGVGTTQVIDVHEPAMLKALMIAIIRHENGSMPYSSAEIDRAVEMVLGQW